jgi:hypothetical protein
LGKRRREKEGEGGRRKENWPRIPSLIKRDDPYQLVPHFKGG